MYEYHKGGGSPHTKVTVMHSALPLSTVTSHEAQSQPQNSHEKHHSSSPACTESHAETKARTVTLLLAVEVTHCAMYGPQVTHRHKGEWKEVLGSYFYWAQGYSSTNTQERHLSYVSLCIGKAAD